MSSACLEIKTHGRPAFSPGPCTHVVWFLEPPHDSLLLAEALLDVFTLLQFCADFTPGPRAPLPPPYHVHFASLAFPWPKGPSPPNFCFIFELQADVRKRARERECVSVQGSMPLAILISHPASHPTSLRKNLCLVLKEVLLQSQRDLNAFKLFNGKGKGGHFGTPA